MLNRMSVMGFVLTLWVAVAAQAEDDRAAYDAKLKAGREAAYKKFLLAAPVQQVVPAAPTGASIAAHANRVARPTSSVIQAAPAPAYLHRSHAVLDGFGDLRRHFYDYPNLLRQQRWGDYDVGRYIFQPTWDSRYRRSWPRPVVVREYVKSHWLWNGSRYTYVPGHAQYETRWVVQGWPRYHWNGSHYSVSVSFNR